MRRRDERPSAGMHRILRIHRTAVAVAVLAILSSPVARARAQGLVDDSSGLVEVEMPFEGGKLTYVHYRGQAYRRIKVNDLRGLALGRVSLNGLAVCVEGKFDRMVARNSFKLMGSDRQLVFAVPALVGGLVRGDNVWIGGTARKMPRGASCYLAVAAVVRLKDDFALFRSRYAKYTKEGSWRKLLELGRRMEESGKLVAGSRIEDKDEYRSSKNKAFRQALRVREDSLEADDADGHYELARMYRDLLARPDTDKVVSHLIQALEADPGHREAAQMLRDMGYRKFGTKWVPEAEYNALVRERERKEAIELAKRGREEGPKPGEAPVHEGLDAPARLRRMLEVEALARSGAEGLMTLAGAVAQEDEEVARRIVWFLANTGGQVALDGLAKAAASSSVAVRKDVVDALAWCRYLGKVSEIVRGDGSAEVRSWGVSALGEMRARENVEALMGLLDVDDEATRSAVSAALRRVTGESLVRPDVWLDWWKRNRGTYKPEGDRTAPP